MNNSAKKSKKVVFCLLTLALLMGLFGDDSELGPCELAFIRCFQDPLWSTATTEGLFHCALGYAFCKKYIDSEKGY